MSNKFDWNLIIPGLWDCCDKPDVYIVITPDNFGVAVRCRNCDIMFSAYTINSPRDVIGEWNKLILERNEKEQVLHGVDINKYPYVYAMR